MEGQLPLATPVAQVGVSKPVLIGECQPTMIRDKMDIAAINGYAGMLFWSLNADYDFTAVADEYAGWCDAHLE
ncbi:MAG: hypothetical protein BWY76_03526 [bacterium ADurb.Bin429]|nr:MAG: hypothetical protein BWY76_03526 [bacterium ADurb.Bin429]